MVSSETSFYLAKASKATEDHIAHVGKERHFSNLQVLAVVGADGQKCELIFLKSGERLNSESYCHHLDKIVFPWARKTYGDNWWWQQDGASCHTSHATQEFLEMNTPHFFDKNYWPPHSPDLSPLDFAIFGRLKSMISGIKFTSKDQLKTALLEA
jgi:hypothetical protein